MQLHTTIKSVLVAACLGATLFAGKQALEFDDILFDFNEISAKAKGKAKGVKGAGGGGKLADPLQIDLRLQADDTFTADVLNAPDPDDATISGSYARKNEFSKKLTLLPDQDGIDALVAQYEAQIAAETEDEGVTAVISNLQVTKQKLRVNIKTKKKKGIASAKLTGKLKFEGVGSIPEIGVNNVEFKVNANVKGNSANEVPLDDITVDGAASPSSGAVDPTGTTWPLPAVDSKTKTKAKKIGKVKETETVSGQLAFGEESTFTATVDDLEMSGTWSRKKPQSKKLDLELDAPSKGELAQHFASEFEAETVADVESQLSYDADKSKLSVVLKTKKNQGTATAKFKTKLKFSGETDGAGEIDAQTQVICKLKGQSPSQPLP